MCIHPYNMMSALSFLLVAGLAGPVRCEAVKPPNILMIVSEDNGPELGCYGDPYARTPHLDQLAASGVRFSRAYVTQSGCSQSRASFLTGLYPHQHGQIGLQTWGFRMYKPDTPNLVRSLKEAGYRTGIIGKLHVSPESAFPFDMHEIPKANFERKNLGDYARYADAFINADDRPFLLSVNYPDAHSPWVKTVEGLPREPVDANDVKALAYLGIETPGLRKLTANYYNCLSRLDSLIGEMLAVLQRSGKADNTVVIYLGDHGADFLRGKRTSYEGGVRIPLIIRWPERAKATQVRKELVSTVDLMPTLLEAAGAKPVENLPGRSLLPLLSDRPVQWRQYLFTEFHTHAAAENFYPQRTVRNGRYKLIENLLPGQVNPGYAFTNNRFSDVGVPDAIAAASPTVREAYERMRQPPRYELYDLDDDPYEFRNLADDPDHEPILTAMCSQLTAWRERTADPLLNTEHLKRLEAEVSGHLDKKKARQYDWGYPRYFFDHAKQPVVQWTAQDAPDFRYEFVENVKTQTLLHATPQTGTFNHHPYLAYYRGVLFASWDNHACDENKSGQHGVFRFSTDQGQTWSDIKTLFPPLAAYEPGTQANLENPFQTSQGFAELDGRLYAVTCVDKALDQEVYRFNEVSRTRVGLLARQVHADGTLGGIFWLSEAAPEPEPGYPAYPPGDPTLVAKINDYFKQPANLPQLLFKPQQWPDSDDEQRMTEPTQPWRLDNGTWVRLWRDQGSIHGTSKAEITASRPRRHYASFSFDDGKTWTAPTRTNFPDSGARSNAGRLPDGQYYVINNILPMDGRRGGRTMLAISLSRDGLLFDRMAVLRFPPPSQRYEGKAKKAPGYQYSHSLVLGKHLWVIYSVSKEDIEIASVPLSSLANLK